MAQPEQIREALGLLAKNNSAALSNLAKVKSVNEAKATCILIDEDGQEYLDVRLRPVLTGKQSFLQIPKIGSTVLAVRIEDDEDWMVIASDEVDKFLWKTPTAQVEVSDKLLMAANGENLLNLMQRLFAVMEKGYQTNNGPTIKLIQLVEFNAIKNDFKKLLK